MPQLAIVMPAYNEEGCLELTCSKWMHVAEKNNGVVIVVNDGSKDTTGEILDRLAAGNPRLIAVHQANAGHGPAVLRGYHTALNLGVQWVFQTDSDNHFKTEEFSRLWDIRHELDFGLGFRSPRSDGLKRSLISKALGLALLVAHRVRIRDSNNPFRLMRASVLADFLQNPIVRNSQVPNVFCSVLAFQSPHIRTREVRVTHLPRNTGVDSLLGMKIVYFCINGLKEVIRSRARS